MQKITVGLMGYGKTGQAVAQVLARDSRFALRWVMRSHHPSAVTQVPGTQAPVVGQDRYPVEAWLAAHPVQALVDFSQPDAVYAYGPALLRQRAMLVSAISAYTPAHLDYLRQLGQHLRVLSSPNITLGINFLILAARLLRHIAPAADVEILEQHFREKPEVSGTARKIAQTLALDDARITSLRLGGIVGHHEVIFGFPYQTVRLVHDSIRREAFGTGAAYALGQLAQADVGFHTFDSLLMAAMRAQLLQVPQAVPASACP